MQPAMAVPAQADEFKRKLAARMGVRCVVHLGRRPFKTALADVQIALQDFQPKLLPLLGLEILLIGQLPLLGV
jgi:hypothetical protein